MIGSRGYEIGPARAGQRRKATVKVRRTRYFIFFPWSGIFMKNAITEMNFMVKRLDVQIELISSDASKKKVREYGRERLVRVKSGKEEAVYLYFKD